MTILLLDFETRSHADLKKVGSHEYSRHPSTDILCAAFRYAPAAEIKTAPTHVWSPHRQDLANGYAWQALVKAFNASDTVFAAHNALFEQNIASGVLLPRYFARAAVAPAVFPPPSRWDCTAARAAALALPRSLAGAAAALRLPVRKDAAGHKLMLKMCKPRKSTRRHPEGGWHETPEDLARLIAYCVQDIEVEAELYARLPPLTGTERAAWDLDQTINQRGFAVDRKLIWAANLLITNEVGALDARTADLTLGLVTSMRERDAALHFLRCDGTDLPDLRADTVAHALGTTLNADSAELLTIRQAISKSSTAKYAALDRRSGTDGRVRDTLLYHGASTGRWSSTGVQVQNLPRGTVKAPIETLAADVLRQDADWLKLSYGNLFEALASAIRGAIVPTPGNRFYCADFNAIELRVLFWLAGHEAGLKALREGRDLYRELAAKIFGVPEGEVDGGQRFIGKSATLGCGYGLGSIKFGTYCSKAGVAIDDGLAKRAVDTYRDDHAPVPKLWRGAEAAAIAAVLDPKSKFRMTTADITWFHKPPFLYCQLPSGRRLAYAEPEVHNVDTPYGERQALHFWNTNPKTRKWELTRTWGGVLVENCCAGDTLVLTSRGWVPIAEIERSDLVFDGTEWVRHGGVVDQGEQETGEWLNIRVTGNHLILAGEKWSSVMSLDEATVSACLSLGRVLVPWWLRSLVLARILAPAVCAIAAARSASRHGLWSVASKDGAAGLWTTISRRGETPNILWHSTGKKERVYDLLNSGPRRRFVVLTSKGPVVMHNCTQAVSRDLLVESMLRVEKAGYQIALTVHDEILAEHDPMLGDLDEFCRLMEQVPEWAADLPVKVSGWDGERYRK